VAGYWVLLAVLQEDYKCLCGVYLKVSNGATAYWSHGSNCFKRSIGFYKGINGSKDLKGRV